MPEKIIELMNLQYGEHDRQVLDLFVPATLKSSSGLLMYIHGGGWSDGDKSVHHDEARYFCELGYITASVNYRFVSDDINIFHELDDIGNALRLIQNKCVDYGFNIKNVLLAGGSAGAHLALMYAYTRKESSVVKPVAVCAYCPPVNCAKDDFLIGISGEFEDWKYGVLSRCCGVTLSKETFLQSLQQDALLRMSPETYLTSDCVPTAVFCGRNDTLVPISHILDFISLLKKNCIKNDMLVFENSGHALDNDPLVTLQAKEIIAEYLKAYL